MQVQENVRGRDVFVVQPTCPPVNENLMELLIMLDALQARQPGADHRRHPLLRLRPAGPQGQRPRADHRQAGGQPDHHRRRRPRAAMDLHAAQIQGFFDIPVDHLYAAPVLCDVHPPEALTRTWWSSPRTPAAWSGRACIAKRLNAPSPSSTSGAPRPNVAEVMQHHRRREGQDASSWTT